MQTPVSRSDALSPSFSPIGRVISAACLVWTSLGQGGERTVWLQQITRVPHPTHPTESHARTCAQTHTHTLETSRTQTHQQNRPVSPEHGANFEAHTVFAVSSSHPALVERRYFRALHLLCCFFLHTGTFQYKVSLIPDVLGFVWWVSCCANCFSLCGREDWLISELLCLQMRHLMGAQDYSEDYNNRLEVVIAWPLFKSEK